MHARRHISHQLQFKSSFGSTHSLSQVCNVGTEQETFVNEQAVIKLERAKLQDFLAIVDFKVFSGTRMILRIIYTCCIFYFLNLQKKCSL